MTMVVTMVVTEMTVVVLTAEMTRVVTQVENGGMTEMTLEQQPGRVCQGQGDVQVYEGRCGQEQTVQTKKLAYTPGVVHRLQQLAAVTVTEAAGGAAA